MTATSPATAPRRLSFMNSDTWRPLGYPVFLGLWLAVLLTNIGNWMETVGARSSNLGRPLAPAWRTADRLRRGARSPS